MGFDQCFKLVKYYLSFLSKCQRENAVLREKPEKDKTGLHVSSANAGFELVKYLLNFHSKYQSWRGQFLRRPKEPEVEDETGSHVSSAKVARASGWVGGTPKKSRQSYVAVERQFSEKLHLVLVR